MIYVSSSLLHKRCQDLEIFWNECLWLEVRINKQLYLIGVFYSPKTADSRFFDVLNQNIEKAFECTQNIVILGDLNEDLLNPNY